VDIFELLAGITDEIEDYPAYLSNINDAFTSYNDGQVALIEQRNQEIEELRRENTDLKAKNYELIMAETGNSEDEDEPDEAEELTIEDKVKENLMKED
jgi:hypothetical protein